MSANTDVWMDFENVRHSIKNNTVDKLKQVVTGLNDECGTHIAKSGKKQELIDRIVSALDTWRAANAEDRWNKAKAIVYSVRNGGTYTPSSRVGGTSLTSTHATYDPPKPHAYSTSVGNPSSIGHYDPYAPPRRPTSITAPVASSSTTKGPPIRFRDSPFFTIDQSVTTVIECPESTSATDRRQQHLSYTLSSDQLTKLKAPAYVPLGSERILLTPGPTSSSSYQIRLFCTSSIFYAGMGSFKTPVPCPIEFPPTCEVRVNGTQIAANLKGLKKKPGTAPPPDLGKYTRLTGTNRIEMVYVNSQQPVQPKKYYMIVMLVEATTTDALVSRLKSQNYRSSQDIQQKMLRSMEEDDDIVAGPQKMSLKCPLTFVRINTPCRSSKCVHPQCFDATSWFTMMEQTTTWLCPVCERQLDHKDLIIDGYFDEILQQTPDSVEDVMVEADGQWHTSDNKHASAQWKASHRTKVLSPPLAVETHAPPPPKLNGSTTVNGKGKALDVEIFVLDSDDEDEGRVKKELSPSYGSSRRESFDGPPQSQSQSQTISHSQTASSVIDLTLDDSDDDVPQPVNNQNKRKAGDAGLDGGHKPQDQLWKKGRIDESRTLPPLSRSSSGSGILPPLGGQYPPSFRNGLPPVFPSGSAPFGGRSNSVVPSLPPLNSLSSPYPRTSSTQSSSSSAWRA